MNCWCGRVYQQTFGWQPEDYPNVMWVGRHAVSLPISAKLSDDEVGSVIKAILAYSGKRADEKIGNALSGFLCIKPAF